MQTEQMVRATSEVLGSPPERIAERAAEVMDRLRVTEKRAQQITRKLASVQAAELIQSASTLNGDDGRLVVSRVTADANDDLLELVTGTARSLGSGVVVLGSVIDGKPQFAAAVTKDMETRGMNARTIAQKVGQAVGGGAGGSASFAQGGGRDGSRLDEGLKEAESFVRSVA
jgi:alanyl-tRNA synthetase